ncbi:MAG TPA: type VI secretion system baseplate subunit TssG [Noviherbaspirillum sp.]
MASSDRRSTRDLIAEISSDGPRFRFFQAVRLLALSASRQGTSGLPAGLRFSTPLSLSFPASEILDVQARKDHARASAAASANEPEADDEAATDALALRLTVGFMGLTGPSGALPTAYTELLIERRNFYRDSTAHQFLDLFSHRTVSLFYQAWRKHRFYLAYEAGDRDSFTRNTLDLVGVGLKSLQSRLGREGGVPDMLLSHYAGLLSQKPVSAVSLAALIRGYFDIEAEIEQFVGQWIAVPETEQTRLGMQSCALGQDAFAGARTWDRQNKIRIRLGPLDETQFADFLPGRPGAEAVTGLVQFCVGHALACDIRLVLRKDRVPMTALGHSTLQLGYNAWLDARPPQAHPDDACFPLLN